MTQPRSSIDASSAVRLTVLGLAWAAMWAWAIGVFAMGGIGPAAFVWPGLVTLAVVPLGVRFAMLEVRVPAQRVYARWRSVSAVQELFVGGLGGLFLWMGMTVPLVAFLIAGEDESVLSHLPSALGPALVCGAIGGGLLFFRPAAVLDLVTGEVRWHFLGPAFPLASSVDRSKLVLAASAHWVTNRGVRRGTAIRVHLPNATSQLELLGLEYGVHEINQRLHEWSRALGLPAQYV